MTTCAMFYLLQDLARLSFSPRLGKGGTELRDHDEIRARAVHPTTSSTPPARRTTLKRTTIQQTRPCNPSKADTPHNGISLGDGVTWVAY